MLPSLSPLGPLKITTDTNVVNLSLIRSDLTDTITLTHPTVGNVSLSATLTATGFIGNGSGLSNLSVGQIVDMPSFATTTQLSSSKSQAIAMAIALG